METTDESTADIEDTAAPVNNSAINWGVAIIAGLILFVTNPNESQLRSHLAEDGWFPLEIERTNLLLLNLNKITGFTGARGLYVGIGGHYFGGEVED